MDFVDTITLRGLDQMTEEEFFHFCQQNPDLRLERTSRGEIVIMSPTGSRSGMFNNEITYQLTAWNKQQQRGYVFDSSTGFTLPDRSMRSPDAAWVPREVWERLSDEEQQRFAPLCPAFVVELKSPTDLLQTLQDKMAVWMANGCRLSWLIDPEREMVYIYRADGSTDHVRSFSGAVSGEDVLPGFALDLTALR